MGDKLPKDYRIALLIVVGTLAAYFSVRTWVVTIAEAQDAPQRVVLERLTPMVEELYFACVAEGRCEGKAGRVRK